MQQLSRAAHPRGAGNSDPDKPAYPLRAYLLAEAFHVSGILAAVAAGIAMHYEQLSGPRLPATRMKSSAVWTMLQTTLNA